MANHTILTTKNIVSSLNNYALKYDDEVDKLDFTVLGLQTYFRTCDIGTFVKFHDDYKKKYSDPSKIINDHARFLQIYKIKIHQKKKKNLELVYRLELGEFSTKPILVISTDSIFSLDKVNANEMLKTLYDECNKIK